MLSEAKICSRLRARQFSFPLRVAVLKADRRNAIHYIVVCVTRKEPPFDGPKGFESAFD